MMVECFYVDTSQRIPLEVIEDDGSVGQSPNGNCTMWYLYSLSFQYVPENRDLPLVGPSLSILSMASCIEV